MSSHRGVSTIAIVLLIVGLVVGAGGGYYTVFNSLQPKIVEYEAQVTQLNSEVYETHQKLAELNESYGALEEVFDVLQEEYATLSGEAETEESNRFARYGFSFEYPEGWTLSLCGNLGSVADEGTGLAAVTSEDETSTYLISWMARSAFQGFLERTNVTLAELIENPEGGLDYAFTTLLNDTSLFPVVELGERVTSIKDGNVLIYQTGTMEKGTGEYQGTDMTEAFVFNCLKEGEFIFAGWYSEESRNDYAFNVIMSFSSGYEPTDIELTLFQFLENFKCS